MTTVHVVALDPALHRLVALALVLWGTSIVLRFLASFRPPASPTPSP